MFVTFIHVLAWSSALFSFTASWNRILWICPSLSVCMLVSGYVDHPRFILTVNNAAMNAPLHVFGACMCTFLLYVLAWIFPNVESETKAMWCWWFSCYVVSNPMDCSLPGSSVHGISWARTLEWVAISSSRGSSWSRDPTGVSQHCGQILYQGATGEAL